MNDNAPVVSFWIFMSCVALAVAVNCINPSANEINASARKEAAVRLADHGASAAEVQCVLDPPMFGRCPVPASR